MSGYYEYPEGQDAFGKVVACNKFAGTAGFIWATADVLMLSKPQGYLPIMARYLTVTAPFVAVATTWSLTTYFATRLRGKDDKLNYAISGYAAAAIFGAIKRSPQTVLVCGTFFAIAGAVKKMSIQQGWEFFPEVTRCVSTARPHDYTLFAHRPGNWTTVAEEKEASE